MQSNEPMPDKRLLFDAAGNNAAQRLAGNIPEIVTLWEQRLRRELPAARRQSQPALIDTLPLYLGQLSRTFASGGANQEEMTELSRRHAAERSRQLGFSLEQLLAEYSVLHRPILDVLEQETRLDEQDARILSETIERAIREAASEYAEIQITREQSLMREVQRTREQIDSLLQSTRDGVATVDLDRRYLYLNDEAARILSAKRREAG